MHLVLLSEAAYRQFEYPKENQRMKSLLVVLLLCATSIFAQPGTGSLKGRVSDELGGLIVGATVTATDANGKTKTVKTNDDGAFTLNGLAPGKYTLHVASTGFGTFENTEVEVVAGRAAQMDVTLKITTEEKVTVNANETGVSTEPENNVGALVLKGPDLES